MSRKRISGEKRARESQRLMERRDRELRAARKRKTKQAKKQGMAIRGEVSRHDIHS